jgi:hypothetical protein
MHQGVREVGENRQKLSQFRLLQSGGVHKIDNGMQEPSLLDSINFQCAACLNPLDRPPRVLGN